MICLILQVKIVWSLKIYKRVKVSVSMIAELFYPMELKKIIRELEEADNLRQEPLKEFNKGVVLIFWLCFLGVVVSLSSADYHSVAFFSFLSIIAMYFYTRDFLKKYKTLYKGGKSSAVIVSIKYRYFLNTVVTLELINGNKTSARFPLILKENHKFKRGSEVAVYLLGEGKGYALPDIPVVKYYYCLRKDLMKGTVPV